MQQHLSMVGGRGDTGSGDAAEPTGGMMFGMQEEGFTRGRGLGDFRLWGAGRKATTASRETCKGRINAGLGRGVKWGQQEPRAGGGGGCAAAYQLWNGCKGGI